MSKKGFKLLCASVFIFIFSTKMIISIAPLIAKHFDRGYINAVITQLEIENDSKTSETKDKIEKEVWETPLIFLTFSCILNHLEITQTPIKIRHHIKSFYPTVPTPPPNV